MRKSGEALASSEDIARAVNRSIATLIKIVLSDYAFNFQRGIALCRSERIKSHDSIIVYRFTIPAEFQQTFRMRYRSRVGQ